MHLGQYGISVNDSILAQIIELRPTHTFGRNDGCSSITELLRNFWTRQSLPCIAEHRHQKRVLNLDRRTLTSIRYLSDLIAVVTVPSPRLAVESENLMLISYQRWPALAFTN